MAHQPAQSGSPVAGAVAAGQALALGNTTRMLQIGVPVEALKPQAEMLRATGAGVMHLAVDGKLAGLLSVSDPIKESPPEALSSLTASGLRIVLATGDGLTTARADVGIAMGTGTDVAMNSAQVTLVKGDLRGIAVARSLPAAPVRNMKQNLMFAFLYNALGIPVAAGVLYPITGWLLSPLIAALAMSFSSVSVIGNALHLRRRT